MLNEWRIGTTAKKFRYLKWVMLFLCVCQRLIVPLLIFVGSLASLLSVVGQSNFDTNYSRNTGSFKISFQAVNWKHMVVHYRLVASRMYLLWAYVKQQSLLTQPMYTMGRRATARKDVVGSNVHARRLENSAHQGVTQGDHAWTVK